MSWQLSLFTMVAAGSAVSFGTFSVIGWQRSKASATAFGWLTFGGLLWAICYGIQLGFTTLNGQLYWQRATLAASSTVPPALLVFALQYAGRDDLLTRRLQAVLAAETAVFAALAFTNPYHHLVWSDAVLRQAVSTPVLDLTFAVGYYVHIVYAYTVVAIALAILFSILLRSTSVYHRQASLLILGALPAFLSHVVYTLGLSPIPGLDLTPFMFTITAVLYALALFHFDLLDRTPIARRNALDLVGDGLLVVDREGLVVDANRVAQQVFDFEPGAMFAHITGETDPEALDNTTMTAFIDGSRHVYDRHVSNLTDDYGEPTGYAIVLRDVTERNTYEQRLEVSNRVLRHNLRNDMNVIQGYASILAETAETPRKARMATTIQDKATDLISLSEKLRQTITYQQSQGELSVPDVVSLLQQLLDEFRDDYPAVTFTLKASGTRESIGVAGIADRELTLAIQNLLENSVEHNDLEGLDVRISVSVRGQRVRIQLRDNGSGLPPVERKVLESGTETPLQHSSGIGLWMTRWIVDTSGGEVSVGSSDAPGTTITVELPRKE